MPQCARCSKSVYPLEELKCLDKVWHKGCFKCTECGMTLNMKTYKGFNKLPYCEAHIPKAKATTVAETPELKRIQENTKIQSNAAYHAEFEKSKGKFTQVTDDPELLRIKANTKIISMVAYHGDLEKKALMEQKRNLSGEGGDGGKNNGFAPPKSPSYMDELSSLPMTPQQPQPVIHHQQQHQPPPPQQHQHQQHQQQQQQQHHQQPKHNQPPQYNPPPSNPPSSAYRNSANLYHEEPQQHQTGGRIPQYNHGVSSSSPYSSRGSTNVIYSSDVGPVNAGSPRKPGSIADYDPVNNYYGSLDPQQHPNARTGAQVTGRVAGSGYSHHHQQQQPQYQQQQQHHHHHQASPQQQQYRSAAPQQQQQQQQQQPPKQPPLNYGVCYRALYDYEAQDNDEISFRDGDLIIDCTAIDEGWMTGTVERTGLRGMLPANYVTPA